MRRAGPKFTRATLRDAIAATKQFPVVTGVITFDANRNPIGKRVVIALTSLLEMSFVTAFAASSAFD